MRTASLSNGAPQMPQLGSAPPGKLAPQLRPGLQSPDGEAQWGPGILGWPSLPCLTPWEVLDTTPPTGLKAQSSRFAPWGSAKSPCPSVPCHVPAVHLCRPSSDDWLAPWGQGPLEQTWQLPSHESKLAAGIQLLGAPSLPWAGLGS